MGLLQSRSFVVPVNGITFAAPDLSKVSVGDQLILAAEPSNPVDPNAIQFRTKEGQRLGYVPKDVAARVRSWEHDAEIVEILEFEGRRAGLRVRLTPKPDIAGF